MGVAVMDVSAARNSSSVTDGPVRQYMGALSEPSIVEEVCRGFETTNEHVLKTMAEWHEFLKLLEQNPKNYKSMCRDGDVEKAIAGLDEAGKNLPRESWSALGKLLQEYDTSMYERFKVVDDNVRAYGALLQEVSWTLLILHREKEPSTGKSYSVDEAIANLRS